jgi:PAT family beta-lactamase induction signal transducer AmpG
MFGGYLVKKIGIKHGMFYSGIAHALSCFAYVVLSVVGRDIHLLYATVFIENVTGGAMGTAFIAFLYSLCDKKYCATQYALLWAFYDFGGVICRTFSGIIADMLGWTNFFLIVPAMFLPSLIILRGDKLR